MRESAESTRTDAGSMGIFGGRQGLLVFRRLGLGIVRGKEPGEREWMRGGGSEGKSEESRNGRDSESGRNIPRTGRRPWWLLDWAVSLTTAIC